LILKLIQKGKGKRKCSVATHKTLFPILSFSMGCLASEAGFSVRSFDLQSVAMGELVVDLQSVAVGGLVVDSQPVWEQQVEGSLTEVVEQEVVG
jgi:hypothetical protein